MTEDIKISEEIDKLKSNITKFKEIVSKAKTVKEKKTSLLKEAKEDKLISKDELKRFSNDIDNFDKISNDKALIKAMTEMLKEVDD